MPSNRNRWISNLPMKQPAFISTMTSIQIRKTTVARLLTALQGYALSRSHSWQNWEWKTSRALKTCWIPHGLDLDLTYYCRTVLNRAVYFDSCFVMNRSIRLSVYRDLFKAEPKCYPSFSLSFSMLPAGTTKENQHWWAPALKMSIIDPLCYRHFIAGSITA